MGTTTDGSIWFGITFDEDYEFPWDAEPFEGDIDDWWYYEAYGKMPSSYVKSADHRDENPIPFELVNTCSCDCPMWGLAIPGTVTTANRGYPEKLDFSEFKVEQADVDKLVAFCDKYFLDISDGPHWYLSSYWG